MTGRWARENTRAARRIAVLLALALPAAAVSSRAEPARDAFITVAGEGQANAAPEFAEFFADVVTRSETADVRPHSERVAKAAALLRGLEKLGVGVERSSFRLEQTRPAPRPAPAPKQPPLEYRASTTFAVKVDRLDVLNDVISSVAAAHLFEVRAIRYGVRDEERVKDDARRAAVAHARRQAEVFAAAAGMALGDILEMFDGIAQNLGSEASLRAATPNMQVMPPATIPFRATINIKWRLVAKP